MLLHESLAKLNLFYLASHSDQFLVDAEKEALKPRPLLERIVELENLERRNRSTQKRLKNAKIGRTKLMHDFDWAWPTEIDRTVIEELLTIDFISRQQNCVFAGSQGVGKSMIAKNIALAAINQGYRALFITASDLVIDLGSQESTPALQRRLRRYIKPDLLIIDELGYLSFDHRAADLLFEIISKRYENGSTIITTNLAFKDWGIPFQGAACVTPLIDRLTHNCEIIRIVGPSYRGKEATARQRGKKHAKNQNK